MPHNAPPILLISPRGMLGRAWGELLDQRPLPYAAVGRPQLDLTHSATIDQHVTQGVEIVINCAAWTDVDGAQDYEAQAMAVNSAGVGALADACRRVGAILVHYSTDYVFDGQAESPYEVDHPRAPINAYGRTKAAGEAAIEASGCDFRLIRTSWLYAPWGKNFVRTMAKLTRERDSLKVVHDQCGRPTSCQHLARMTFKLLGLGEQGSQSIGPVAPAPRVWHITDAGQCSWFEFASEINRQMGHDCQIFPCTTADFPRPAKRPAYSVLDLSQTVAHLGPMPDWHDNLRSVLSRLEEDEN